MKKIGLVLIMMFGMMASMFAWDKEATAILPEYSEDVSYAEVTYYTNIKDGDLSLLVFIKNCDYNVYDTLVKSNWEKADTSKSMFYELEWLDEELNKKDFGKHFASITKIETTWGEVLYSLVEYKVNSKGITYIRSVTYSYN